METSSRVSSKLGFKHRILKGEPDVLKDAVETIIKDGFPNNGINKVHKYALELVANDYSVVLPMEQGEMTRFQNSI